MSFQNTLFLSQNWISRLETSKSNLYFNADSDRNDFQSLCIGNNCIIAWSIKEVFWSVFFKHYLSSKSFSIMITLSVPKRKLKSNNRIKRYINVHENIATMFEILLKHSKYRYTKNVIKHHKHVPRKCNLLLQGDQYVLLRRYLNRQWVMP